MMVNDITETLAHTHTRIRTHAHTRTNTRMHARTHTHVRTHAHTGADPGGSWGSNDPPSKIILESGVVA